MQTTMVQRAVSFPDAELAARHLGRVDVAIRSADRPTQALGAALVTLRLADHAPVRRVTQDGDGVARFDTLPSGQYELRVERIGYYAANLVVPITDGCRIDVEVYLSVQFVGLVEATTPQPTGRSTITTCGTRE